jgi:hypothetical protein
MSVSSCACALFSASGSAPNHRVASQVSFGSDLLTFVIGILLPDVGLGGLTKTAAVSQPEHQETGVKWPTKRGIYPCLRSGHILNLYTGHKHEGGP